MALAQVRRQSVGGYMTVARVRFSTILIFAGASWSRTGAVSFLPVRPSRPGCRSFLTSRRGRSCASQVRFAQAPPPAIRFSS